MEEYQQGKDLVKRRGTCELCGAHKRELRVLILSDFIGWACPECMRQLRKCTPRRYCATGEETETAE